MSCQITGNKSEYILCTYCKRNHRGGASNCHVRMRDLIAKDEAEKKTSADAKLSVIQAEIGEVTRKSNLKLDTCASMHFTGDINKLEDISVGEPIRVNGFDGNSKVSNIYGNIPDLGRAVYIAGMPSTLISLGSLKDNGFDVSFDDKTSSFQVSKGDVRLRFNKSESNIWTGDFIEAMECVACNSDVSNTPRVRSTTNEELDRFDKLDIIHRNLHHPSDAVLKRMIRNGKIIGTPCVASDVDKYREKYGLCEGCAKGKMTAKAAHPSLTPRSSKCGDLVHVDLMFVGGFIFIVAVDDYSRKKIVVEVASKQKADIIHGIESMTGAFLEHGFGMLEIRHDGEGSLVNSVNDLNVIGVKTSLSTPGDHTRIAEVAIRVLKSKIRATIFGLDFEFPKQLIPYLVHDVVLGVNMTLSEDREETPNEIFHGRKYDANMYGKCKFGDFGYFRSDPKGDEGSLQERSVLCMVVGKGFNGGSSVRVF